MVKSIFGKMKINFSTAALMLAVMLAAANFAKAQEFNATVDRTTVGQNEQFQVYFTFTGKDVNSVSNFRQPNFAGFRVLSGPNQSTSMQIINGSVSASLTFSYIVQPSAVGKFTIGAASLDYTGKTYTSKPISITVEKGNPAQAQSSSGSQVNEAEIAKNVFIVATASKSRVFQGQQVTVTYKLYTRLNMSSPQITKLPTYEGFWAEELTGSNAISFQNEMYKGERFRSAVIKQVALFPTKFGTLSVTPFELSIPVIVKRKKSGNDVFDDFFNDSFFGRSETVDFHAKSNTLKIQVDPLPAGNVPASFNGAVGNFNLKSEIDKKDAAVNESVTLRFTVSGSGNIELLKLQDPQLPAGVEKYDPKVYDNVNKSSVINGQKIFEYLIVPRTPGEKTIPALAFTYFNPDTRKYVTLESQAFKINVRQTAGDYQAASSQGFSKEDIRLLSEDIRYIKTTGFGLMPIREISFIKSWFWISLVLPAIALLVLLGYKKRQDKLSGNLQLMRYQKAEKAAKKKLNTAKKALDKGNNPAFFAELSLALFGYLEDKLGIQKSEFTLELALEKLRASSVNDILTERVKVIAEKCEFARFAPQGLTSEKSLEIYDEAVKVIIELDNSIAARRKK